MNRDAAETIALQALGYFASDPEALDGLMVSTGIDPDSLKSAGSEPGILIGVLDYLLQNDERTLAFCEAQGLPPLMPGQAWSTLTGQNMS
jgi:hypothetical protein